MSATIISKIASSIDRSIKSVVFQDVGKLFFVIKIYNLSNRLFSRRDHFRAITPEVFPLLPIDENGREIVWSVTFYYFSDTY